MHPSICVVWLLGKALSGVCILVSCHKHTESEKDPSEQEARSMDNTMVPSSEFSDVVSESVYTE